MKLSMFETHIPAWSNYATWASRLTEWKKAGIQQVQFVVEDGNGATWPSTSQTDSRVDVIQHPLRRAVTMIRQMGMDAVPVFGFAGIYNSTVNIRPEFLLDIGGMYNVWNPAFVTWRLGMIAELVNYIPFDLFGIDYIRCGRWARPGELPQHQVLDGIMAQIKGLIPDRPLMSITNSLYHSTPNGQGIDVLSWYHRKWTNKIAIFNYDPVFPESTVKLYPPSDLCLTVGNYNVDGLPAVAKTDLAMETMLRQMQKINPEYLCLFNGNLHQPEHTRLLRSQVWK